MKTDAQSAAGQPVQSEHHWYTSLIKQTSVETGRTAVSLCVDHTVKEHSDVLMSSRF